MRSYEGDARASARCVCSAGGVRGRSRAASKKRAHRADQSWVATWTAAQHAPSNDLFTLIGEPSNPGVAGFNDQTVRNIAFTSIGGDVLRVHLSNQFGTQPVTIGHAAVGVELAGAQLVAGTNRTLTFAGQASATIPVGGEVTSDPVRLSVLPLENLAVSVFLPTATGRRPITSSLSRRTTSRPVM